MQSDTTGNLNESRIDESSILKSREIKTDQSRSEDLAAMWVGADAKRRAEVTEVVRKMLSKHSYDKLIHNPRDYKELIKKSTEKVMPLGQAHRKFQRYSTGYRKTPFSTQTKLFAKHLMSGAAQNIEEAKMFSSFHESRNKS